MALVLEIRHRHRWCEVKADKLALIDAKAGPRHALLGDAVREGSCPTPALFL